MTHHFLHFCMKRLLKNLSAPKLLILLLLPLFDSSCFFRQSTTRLPLDKAKTIAGMNREFGEPFGIAVRKNEIYVSDGEKGVIWKIVNNSIPQKFASGLDTPSQIAFDKDGNLIIADTGSHSIKKADLNGSVSTIAGVDGKPGYRDGGAKSALFRAPVGIAVSGEIIYVADTYNDRIRVIENGAVSTLAGNRKGFADSENGIKSRFDTPCSLAIWSEGKILVADTGNRRIRVIEADGKTWTLTGSGNGPLMRDGLLSEARFAQPAALTVNESGVIYVSDENAIRVIGRRALPLVETISQRQQGFSDGKTPLSRFNRPSGLAADRKENVFITDSSNQLVRVLTGSPAGAEVSRSAYDKTQVKAKEFRQISHPRWPFNPPDKKREIAGTMGEIRGEIEDDQSQAWFHNGLDIVGGYGETARFIRSEKVLQTDAVQNFDTSRESLRMPTLGYIHIRIGRDVNGKPYSDPRFQFSFDSDGSPIGLRIPRGVKFRAGEPIGSLNKLNHVHLVAGRAGKEMNPLDALVFTGVSDTRLPIIEDISFYNENWDQIENDGSDVDVDLTRKVRLVVTAYDQMDGNASRRRLGLYRLGYQILGEDTSPLNEFRNPFWTIKFDELNNNASAGLVYAPGSKSGATGKTVFRYIVTNVVSGKVSHENFLKLGKLDRGNYILRVFAADFFGNTASKDIALTIN